MNRIGVRDAKERLSKLLRDVRRGREWIITDRGVPVAKLLPVRENRETLGECIERLEDIGALEALARSVRPLPPPLPLEPGLAQRWLREDRSAT
ncbi:MAG: type II toxin-antitoxin system Phd/YefM family antitoxin [Candidatus Tyrphobacter sp.]